MNDIVCAWCGDYSKPEIICTNCGRKLEEAPHVDNRPLPAKDHERIQRLMNEEKEKAKVYLVYVNDTYYHHSFHGVFSTLEKATNYCIINLVTPKMYYKEELNEWVDGWNTVFINEEEVR